MNLNKKGFTLIEMLLTVAILAILSGSILVSISAQREKAKITRMLSELSGSIQAIEMCISDGGNINSPSGSSGGGSICSISSSYGMWPSVQSGFSTYTSFFSGGSWYVSVSNSDTKICCNSHVIGCEKLTLASTCNTSTP